MKAMRRAIGTYPWYVHDKQIFKDTGYRTKWTSLRVATQKCAQNLREKITVHEKHSIQWLADFSSKHKDGFKHPYYLF